MFGEALPHARDRAKLLLAERWELGIDRLDPLDDGGSNNKPRDPFVIGRHDVPWRVIRRRRPDHVLVRRHIFVPQLALADIASVELPLLGRIVDAFEEALFLLPPGHVEKELERYGAV